MTMETVLRLVLERIRNFEVDAHSILSNQEDAPSRIVTLNRSYDELAGLSLQQDELFRQSLRCVEVGLFRAGHVLAWAALMDFLEEKLSADGLVKLRSVRPNWKAGDVAELREHHSEYQIVEAAKELNLLTKNQMKALHGLLNRRNECAHPSDYFPGLNESLGFISELFKRIKLIQARVI